MEKPKRVFNAKKNTKQKNNNLNTVLQKFNQVIRLYILKENIKELWENRKDC